ncbi:MAG: hypothetical protein NT151_06690 [Acidobacteria bacterium]|nr:hypothetical protein [Acidobacteriota bacterium]
MIPVRTPQTPQPLANVPGGGSTTPIAPDRPPAPLAGSSRRPPRRSLVDVLWDLKQLYNIAVRLEERIDDLYWDLHDRHTDAPASSANDGGRGPRPRASGTLRSTTAPVAWVSKLTTKQRPDGSLVVSLNGQDPFLLQPHLGALLLALAEDTGLSRDEGVGFKTLRDLSVRIGKHTGGQAPNPDTINKYVCKLRKQLCQPGLQGDIIQTNRRLGRRLAVKRSSRTGA